MSRQIVHHAHHPAEGLYRLVHAEVVQDVVPHEVINPAFDPGEEESVKNSKTMMITRTITVHLDHREIVWDADAEEWRGLSDEAIAAEQRRIVREAHRQRAADSARAPARGGHRSLLGDDTTL